MESEIDLRAYILAIWNRRWLILVSTLLAGAAAAVMSFMAPKIFEVTAGVAIIRSGVSVDLEPRIAQLPGSGGVGAASSVNGQARRGALAALVANGAIAAMVIEELGDELSAAERRLSALVGMVEGSIVGGNGQGDLIEITVRALDPGKAATLANAWGRAYVAYVNDMYGQSGQSGRVQQALVDEASLARGRYEVSEEALVQFLAASSINELTQKIWAIERLIRNRRAALSIAYEGRVRAERLLENVRALRIQIREGPASVESGVNTLALSLLKAQAFAALDGLPMGFQFGLGTVPPGATSRDEQLQDLDAFVVVLEAMVADFGRLIEMRSDELARGETYDSASADTSRVAESLYPELRQLTADLEQHSAIKRELGDDRNIAWNTFTTLAREADEISIAAELGGTEVRFAIPALEPGGPVSPRTRSNVFTGLAIGLILGLAIAFLVDFLSGVAPLSDAEVVDGSRTGPE